jgi:hypothetical protein
LKPGKKTTTTNMWKFNIQKNKMTKLKKDAR